MGRAADAEDPSQIDARAPDTVPSLTRTASSGFRDPASAGHAADELRTSLPTTPVGRRPVLSLQARPDGRPRPAGAPPDVRDLGVLAVASRAFTSAVGKVARGGLRWSDRRKDFRTEVLGLMKAQMVKNAVIVPPGAKGGFVVKQLPSGPDRDALAGARRTTPPFIAGLLDVTDNRGRTARRSSRRPTSSATTATTPTSSSRPTRGRPRSPTSPTPSAELRVLARRRVRLRRQRRLRPQGDGHHRARRVGERARHSRSLGATTPTATRSPSSASATCRATCSATGCSARRHMRLVAAFDHRHIFVDPDPDPATRLRRAQRLFDLPRLAGPTTTAALISRAAASTTGPPKSIRCPERSRRDAARRDRVTLTPTEPSVSAILHGARRPAVERRHRHLREGVQRGEPRRRRRPRQRRPPRRWNASSCAARSSARAATSASPSGAASSTRSAAAASTPTPSTTRPASTPPTTRSTSRSC